MALTSKKLYLRKVQPDDIHILFDWVNDIQVRNNAFHTDVISYGEHQKWFEHLLSDNSQVQYILMSDDAPIGQIRFLLLGEIAQIDYSIAPNKRGFGYGALILKLAQEEIQTSYPLIHTLIGQVKTGNLVSERCFLRCGFKETFKQFELKCKE